MHAKTKNEIMGIEHQRVVSFPVPKNNLLVTASSDCVHVIKTKYSNACLGLERHFNIFCLNLGFLGGAS